MKKEKKRHLSFLRKIQRRVLPVFLSLVMVVGYIPTNLSTAMVWAESGGAEAVAEGQQPMTVSAEPKAQQPAEASEPVPETPQPEETPAEQPIETPEPQPVETPAPEQPAENLETTPEAQQPAETPDVEVETPVKQPTETPAETPAEQPVETPVATPEE